MHLAIVSEWLAKITEAGVRRRAEIYYQQLDALRLCASKCAESYWRKAGNIRRDEIAAADSFDRPDPRRFVDCSDADTPSLPYQAATVGLLRTGIENLR